MSKPKVFPGWVELGGGGLKSSVSFVLRLGWEFDSKDFGEREREIPQKGRIRK